MPCLSGNWVCLPLHHRDNHLAMQQCCLASLILFALQDRVFITSVLDVCVVLGLVFESEETGFHRPSFE